MKPCDIGLLCLLAEAAAAVADFEAGGTRLYPRNFGCSVTELLVAAHAANNGKLTICVVLGQLREDDHIRAGEAPPAHTAPPGAGGASVDPASSSASSAARAAAWNQSMQSAGRAALEGRAAAHAARSAPPPHAAVPRARAGRVEVQRRSEVRHAQGRSLGRSAPPSLRARPSGRRFLPTARPSTLRLPRLTCPTTTPRPPRTTLSTTARTSRPCPRPTYLPALYYHHRLPQATMHAAGSVFWKPRSGARLCSAETLTGWSRSA